MDNLKKYNPHLSASLNRKGVLDVDTVKGCEIGTATYPDGGCYGLCYAYKTAKLYGYNFNKSISRKITNCKRVDIEKKVKRHNLPWFRTGNMGDPSHDWDNTVYICEWLGKFKTPVVVTKHWVEMLDSHAAALRKCGAVINTSITRLTQV